MLCTQFYCSKKRSMACCYFCSNDNCEDRCLNTPQKCKLSEFYKNMLLKEKQDGRKQQST
jgi:hypothetical protein